MIERVAPVSHSHVRGVESAPPPSFRTQRSKLYFRIAMGTSMQYPIASRIGAIVSPPRAKSANPAMITTAVIAHHITPRVRDDASISVIGGVV